MILKDASYKAGEEFEDEVRRVARSLWASDQYSGAALLEGKERDGIFQTEECIHILEATTSRQRRKAEKDGRKMFTLAKKWRGRSIDKPVQCWFVTKDEPTADQRAVLGSISHRIRAVSFSQFQSKLIDSRSYLECRGRYFFGSVRDPASGSLEPSVDYIPLDVVEAGSGSVWSVDEIASGLLTGSSFVLLGDYGAGKSMTLREVYKSLKKRHLKGLTATFPVYVNLRDHWGQLDSAELLERHGKKIGFGQSAHLVRAWRAGYVVLLLDGFDELAPRGFQGLWRKLSELRYRTMKPIRGLVREQPQQLGYVLAGRGHFFDSATEMHKNLGVKRERTHELSLSEFSDEQVTQYLKAAGLTGAIPSWLPTRPLLVGYLASRGLLSSITDHEAHDGVASPAEGWDALLDAVTEREAQIEVGIDGGTVRRILERLATKVRLYASGTGLIRQEELVDAFKEVCGYTPDEAGLVLLQRLPGLGVVDSDDEGRTFVDEDFVDACKAGDIAQFVRNPYDESLQLLGEVSSTSGDLCIEIVSMLVGGRRQSDGQLLTALEQSQGRFESDYLAYDLVRCALLLGTSLQGSRCVVDVAADALELSTNMGVLRGLTFRDCYFSRVSVDPGVLVEEIPLFEECYIGELEAPEWGRNLPEGRFAASTVVDQRSSTAGTTDAILNLDLPVGVRVLMTILRKLYIQRGRGRKEGALYRGLGHREQRFVGDVLSVVKSAELALPSRLGGTVVWLPDRSKMARVGRILV